VSNSERIVEQVTSWPGVEAGPGRRGELAFKVGGREIGHLGRPRRDRALRLNYDRIVGRHGLPAQAA
jgi:Family of unknown function (DUF5519)